MAAEKLLIIEDETKIARFVELELQHEGYVVETSDNGRIGLEKALTGNFDLIILDVMLPGLNGMEVLRRLRHSSDVAVIMLTAKDEVTDKVMGLDIGADDYMTKPFAIEELLARIRSALRKKRAFISSSHQIILGHLTIDLDKHSVTFKDEELDLTKKEYDLLIYLAENKNIALTRDKILNIVWGIEYYGETNVVDVYVRYLRSKIDDKFGVKIIHTVRGVGYIIKHE